MTFLFSGPPDWGSYAFVALRVVVAAAWLESDVPRWLALAAGRPVANGLVRYLFGVNLSVSVTYLFTLLETLAAISFLLGFLTRLASIWASIEFAIIDAALILDRSIGQVLVFTLLLVTSTTLLINGGSKLSIDELIAKRMRDKSN